MPTRMDTEVEFFKLIEKERCYLKSRYQNVQNYRWGEAPKTIETYQFYGGKKVSIQR